MAHARRTMMLGMMMAAVGVAGIYPTRDAAAAGVSDRIHALPLLHDSLLGISGKLRARFLPMIEAAEMERALGDLRASFVPGTVAPRVASLQVLSMLPFETKIAGRMGLYRMGYWPGERRPLRTLGYAMPSGFVQVTLDNQDMQVSEHFRLRDFVTKDQFAVWPKYVVLREPLLDKLKLTLDELARTGYPVAHLQVMSGFRHPAYNALGIGAGGRATESRHQYGDAADVFPDSDRDGRTDDLNGDGRVNARDVELIIRAVERVEAAHPELNGGLGRYHATNAHGPFVHIDVRGTTARWGGA